MNNYIVEEEFNNFRIDQFLAQSSEYSRSKIVKLIKEGLILVDDEVVKPSYIVKTGETVQIAARTAVTIKAGSKLKEALNW